MWNGHDDDDKDDDKDNNDGQILIRKLTWAFGSGKLKIPLPTVELSGWLNELLYTLFVQTKTQC